MQYQRVKVINQGFIRVPAAKVWAALTDWGGTKRLRAQASQSSPGTSADSGGRRTNTLGIIGVELDGDEDTIPRTRVLKFEDGRLMRETLLHQDDDALHIYYNIEAVGAFGIRNYLATNDVDDLEEQLCQMTITARFDLAPGLDVVAAKAFIDTAHNGVIAGMRALATATA